MVTVDGGGRDQVNTGNGGRRKWGGKEIREGRISHLLLRLLGRWYMYGWIFIVFLLDMGVRLCSGQGWGYLACEL